MAEVTTMILKVDLECKKCYRKIKSLLCKYPEIQNQVYYEKDNAVMITVVCCSPERIRQKLICKGGKTIKSIEIRTPEKPKPPPPEKPKEADKPKPAPAPAPPVVVVPKEVEKPKPPPPEKPKEAEKPKTPPPEKPKEAEKPKPAPAPEKPKEAEKPKPAPEKPKEAEKPKPAPEKPKEAEKPKPVDPPPPKPVEKPPPPLPAPPPVAAPAQGYPPFYPIAVCCKPCFDLGYGGPCHHGHGAYGTPYQPPPTSYDGYVRLVPSYDEPAGGWSSGCSCNRSYGGCRCECVVTEEPSSCTIM